MIFKIATCEVLSNEIGQTATLHKDNSEWGFEKRPGMLYVVVRAVSVGTNGNGDHFTRAELEKSYKTFIGKGVFVNHASNDVEKKRGRIVDAKWCEERGDTFIKTVLEVNAEAFPELAAMIKSGQIDSVSMGCSVAFSNCSICSHAAKTTKDYCLVPNTKITMFDGSVKSIDKIEVGDVVLSAYGTPDEVTEIMSRHIEEDIINFAFTGSNANLKVTIEHPILSYKSDWAKCTQCRTMKSCTHVSKKKNPQFIHSDYLGVNDYFLTPANISTASLVDSDLAELVGYYAAEGSLVNLKGKLSSVQFSIAATEADTLGNRICELSQKLFGITPRKYFANNGCSVRIHNANVANVMNQFCPGKARTKQLDSSLMLSDVNAQMALLSAIIEGDGYYDSNHESIVYRTSSGQLANQVAVLANNLGYYSKTHGTYQNGGPSHRERQFKTIAVTITKTNDNNDIHKLSFGKLAQVNSCQEKAMSLFRINNHVALKIKEKSYVPYTGLVYNFETKDTHSYVANGVAVHNCFHIKMHKGGAYNGRPVYEENHGIEFIEVSFVTTGADPQAKVLEVLARKRGLNLEHILQKAASSEDPNFVDNLEIGTFSIEKTVLNGIRRANSIRGEK